MEVSDTFSTHITAFLQEKIKHTCDRVQAARTKRAKLWGLFHQLRTDKKGVLVNEWNQMLCNLKIEIFDPICMQLIYENIFERLVKEELDKDCTSKTTVEELVNPSADELNALRYAAGFVPHSLLKRFEKRRGDKFSKFITCLEEMAVVGEGGDILSYTSKWLTEEDCFPSMTIHFLYLLLLIYTDTSLVVILIKKARCHCC